MLIEHQHPDNKSIMISILGAPNVGKSSLINNFLGMDLSIVTHRPQTTRNKFNCITTIDRTEVILVDTPGIHQSNQEFNKRLNEQAKEGTYGADLNFLLIDLSYSVFEQINVFKNNMTEDIGRTWMIFTKRDCIKDSENLPLAEIFKQAQSLMPQLEKFFFISAKDNTDIHLLTGAICDVAESGPHLYEGGDISNKNERFFVSEYIREQAFLLLKDEIPYEVAVTIDEYNAPKEKRDQTFAEKHNMKNISYISASILVNRPSQRAIVVGSKGSMIKEIGIRSRAKIENLVGGQVHLNLHVKVSPRWFKNNFVLEEIGLPRAANSNRVWRSKGSKK